MTSFKTRHAQVISGAGGIVTGGMFVSKVGVMMTKKSSITKDAEKLFEKMNIDPEMLGSKQHAEFNSLLTYLSFKEETRNTDAYHTKLIKELGHRSIYNDEMVTFLIAGCSIETMIEFLAHNEATVARLTSSKTKAQDEGLYRLRVEGMSKSFIETQKMIIKEFEYSRKRNRALIDETNEVEREIFNVMSLGCKAVSFTITMSIKDWHKTLIGRLSNHGVESEMIEILNDVTDKLNLEYPDFFETKENYYEMGNSKKYE